MPLENGGEFLKKAKMRAERELVIKNRTGLHARPAAVFVQIANKYESEITIVKEEQRVNGKSIMGILTLAAEKGARITVIAEGQDAEQAIEDLCNMLLNDTDPQIGA